MSFYALATVEIQNHLLITVGEVKQVWLANDATGAGSLESLKKWWVEIEECGCYGYYVIQSKSWLILKNQILLKKKKEIFFSDTKINGVTEHKKRGT